MKMGEVGGMTNGTAGNSKRLRKDKSSPLGFKAELEMGARIGPSLWNSSLIQLIPPPLTGVLKGLEELDPHPDLWQR